MIERPNHNRYFAYLNSAVIIIKQYDGKVPLAAYLKQFFAQHKKYGSKDRKQIAHLCYCYYRLGKLNGFKSIEQRILKGVLIATPNIDEGWLYVAAEFEADKITVQPEHIFPWQDNLSDGVDAAVFSVSHIHQPHVYLRIRPGHEVTVCSTLKKQAIPFVQQDQTIILNTNVNIQEVLKLDKEVVVQDLSSQKISELFLLYQSLIKNKKTTQKVWDCCAASGGKSILAKDYLGNIQLVATDIRTSIIQNLKKRFEQARINSYQAYILDAAKAIPKQKFNLILADVPCTGSGTWSRTPEALFYFDTNAIKTYVALQRSILDNIVSALHASGYLLYSTCSVFKEENENQIKYLQEKYGFTIIQSHIIKGYNQKADTMFAALLKL